MILKFGRSHISTTFQMNGAHKHAILFLSRCLSLSFAFCFGSWFDFTWQTECTTHSLSNKNLIYRFYVQNHTTRCCCVFLWFPVHSAVVHVLFVIHVILLLVEHIKMFALKRTEVEFIRLTWTIFLSPVHSLAF